MADLNIEEKIHEALKKKNFKDNKTEYLGLSLVFCLLLFITFVVSYFVPFLSIFIFLLVDIPLIMGFKHFIWFGPASGETLIEGFKVSMICGYLNFISYIKIFFTTHFKPFILGIVAMLVSIVISMFIVEGIFASEINSIMEKVYATTTIEEIIAMFNENKSLSNAMLITEIVSLVIGFLTFFAFKLKRGILPYVSFLRLTNLEGKTMDGVISHTKKVIKTKPSEYYLKSMANHLLYIVPACLAILMYFLLSRNPVYSFTTIALISTLTFFISMSPAVLFVELNYRNFCLKANQEYVKEHKKMLNDAINDLNKKK